MINKIYSGFFVFRHRSVVLLSFLLLGNLVGAGILGLPNVTGIMGFIPTLLVLMIFCLGMLYTAFIITDEILESGVDFFNYPSIYQKYLGDWGKWIAISANLLIFYGSITAYLTGGTQIILGLFHLKLNTKMVLIVFFVLLTSITSRGFVFIQRFNGMLIIFKWLTFLTIVFFGLKYIRLENLGHMDVKFIPFALPVVSTVFTYHNIIPNVCAGALMKKRRIYSALKLGMLMGLAMNLLWCLVGIGVIPLKGSPDGILYIYKNSIPALVPLGNILNWEFFTLFCLAFGMIGMFTAYITQSIGLLAFNKDMFLNYFNIKSPVVSFLCTFIPPVAICLINPDIFIKALTIIGAYGISILFGILPGLIAVLKKNVSPRRKICGWLIIIMFSMVILFDILNKLGIIKYSLL